MCENYSNGVLDSIKSHLNKFVDKTVIVESHNGISQGTYIADFYWYQFTDLKGVVKIAFDSNSEDIMVVFLEIDYVDDFYFEEWDNSLTILLKNEIILHLYID